MDVFEFGDTSTLKQEMLNMRDLSVTFSNHFGCSSHFYHLVVNYAIPLFGKAVDPFLQSGMTVPQVRVHVHDTGGPVQLLREMLPDLNLSFSPTVFECCAGQCAGDCGNHNENHSASPNYVISSACFFDGQQGYLHMPVKMYRPHLDMARRFRHYVLSHGSKQVLTDTWTKRSDYRIAFISRRSQAVHVPIILGNKNTGAKRRDIPNEDELVLRLSKLAMQTLETNFSLVHPDGYTFMQQVALFRHVNLLLGAHGAGIAHCLWLSKESSVVTITDRGHKEFYYKWLCGQIAGVKYREYIVEDDYQVPVDAFLSVVKEEVVALPSPRRHGVGTS